MNHIKDILDKVLVEIYGKSNKKIKKEYEENEEDD